MPSIEVPAALPCPNCWVETDPDECHMCGFKGSFAVAYRSHPALKTDAQRTAIYCAGFIYGCTGLGYSKPNGAWAQLSKEAYQRGVKDAATARLQTGPPKRSGFNRATDCPQTGLPKATCDLCTRLHRKLIANELMELL